MTKSWAFIGSQTRWQKNAGEGIYICHFDHVNGALTRINIFSDIENPSFLTITRDGCYLYAVIEIDNFAGEKSGAVAAFSIHPRTAALTLLNRRATGGASPCYISLDKTEQTILVANYAGGSVAVFPIQADGSLSERNQLIQYHGASIHPNQTLPHAHSAITSPDNRYALVQDLGTDTIRQYNFHIPQLVKVGQEENNYLTDNQPASISIKPGAGPRHLIFHTSLPIAYLINELDNTVVVFDYDIQQGCLFPKQTISSLPTNFTGQNSAADIHITHSGRFLYTSNRGHDSLAMFMVHPHTGELTALGYQSTLGEHPRNFTISSDDRLLICANRNTDNIVSFYLDAHTGQLTPTGQDNHFYKPMCMVISPWFVL